MKKAELQKLVKELSSACDSGDLTNFFLTMVDLHSRKIITDDEYNYVFNHAKFSDEAQQILEPWSDEYFTEENDPLIVGIKGRK